MKSGAEVMEMLEAYDLTGSTRSAAALVGCSHHTVDPNLPKRWRLRTTRGGSTPTAPWAKIFVSRPGDRSLRTLSEHLSQEL